MNFIGHEKTRQQINNIISTGMFSHAHLVIGEDGIGKSVLAKEIAIKLLNKDNYKQYADIIEFRLDKGKKSIGVETIRGIIEEISKRPYEGDKKVIIIYEGDKMTTEAQNAFLKTIEEPPAGVYILLLCENLNNILDTIKSRCQVIKLQRLTGKEMELFIQNKYPHLKPEEAKSVAIFSEGIPGRAEKFIENVIYKEMRELAIKILQNSCNHNTLEMLKFEDALVKNKNEWQELLTIELSFIRDVMVYKEAGNEKLIINLDKINNIKDMAAMFSFTKLSAIIDIINETEQKLERNVNTALVFDMMLIKMQEV